jgi:hypothetical protein
MMNLNMKNKLSLLIIFLSAIPCFSFSQSWIWANRSGSLGDDYGVGVAVDLTGNVYAVSAIDGPEAYFQTDTFIVNGINDLFL